MLNSTVELTPNKVSEREILYDKYSSKLVENPDLNRAIVSFQANKSIPFYRWLKYKEAFSSDFVTYVLNKFEPKNYNKPWRVLDPFAGIGTTLTAATKKGWQATGIELLPIGFLAIKARLLADEVDISLFKHYLSKVESTSFKKNNKYSFPHISITYNAFPKETEDCISGYLSFIDNINNDEVRFLFKFACLSILEEISYTRKDGQFLRWDARSGRRLKSSFYKTHISDFKTAILNKLYIMLEDILKRNGGTFAKNVNVIEGSCLSQLPLFPDNYFNMIITSPPYCNRYDYTRTYALELAFLGYNEEDIKNLRQTLLSATVENKTKKSLLAKEYQLRNKTEFYLAALESFKKQSALQELLFLLNQAANSGRLNNKNIPIMVENYFFEMNIVIHELSRILLPGGHIIMVNDNVQYIGEEIPVDLILSDLAANAGLSIDSIWVLPKGKGNSSQQMGIHGRKELRKCVYVWSKP